MGTLFQYCLQKYIYTTNNYHAWHENWSTLHILQLSSGLTERINIGQITIEAMINERINTNTTKLPQQCDITVYTETNSQKECLLRFLFHQTKKED